MPTVNEAAKVSGMIEATPWEDVAHAFDAYIPALIPCTEDIHAEDFPVLKIEVVNDKELVQFSCLDFPGAIRWMFFFFLSLDRCRIAPISYWLRIAIPVAWLLLEEGWVPRPGQTAV